MIGLTGFTWLEEILPPSALTLYAAIELAGTPGDQMTEPATLPIKVHLINSVLSSKCYVATNASPIKLNLITGSVPGANGCQLTLFEYIPISINGPINEQSAPPSPAGYNQTIQEFDTETSSAPVWVHP